MLGFQTGMKPEQCNVDRHFWTVTGHFGQDPFRPCFLAETSLISWTFRPTNMDVSAKKNYYYYIAAEMFLRTVCLCSATLLAAAIP